MADFIQRSFTAGELAPSLRSRVDIAKYQSGLRLCENFITRAQGGVYNRPGTRFIGEVGDSTKKARLISFSFNVAQTYILVFEHLKMRVISNGAYIMFAGVPYEITTTYTEAQLSKLYVTQNADVMTIVHHDHDPRTLSRLGDTNWVLAVISYAPTVAAPTAPTLTAVGAGAGTNAKTYRYVITAVNASEVESIASPPTSISTPSLSTTAGLRVVWGASDGVSYYRVYKEPGSDGATDTGFYGWIGDSKSTTFIDFNLAPITSDAPPIDRTPFAGANNKPATVTYYQQRQVFANTKTEPQTVFTTQTGNYVSLRVSNPTRSDDAVTFTIAARQVNEIRHLIPLTSLVILTSGGEWKLTEGQDQVLTPSSAGVRPQTFNGASWVAPVLINNTALYVQEKGTRIRDIGYESGSDSFTGNDLSMLSEHLFENYLINEMAYCGEPYGIVWCVRSDGVLLGLTYQREQQVVGWHRHTTDGVIESIASITEGSRDALYLIVKRTIGGVAKRYIERMEPREKTVAADCFYVDSGLSYSGAPVTVLSGLAHLEGKAVVVLADGNVVTGLVVTAGAITLPRAAAKVHVGLPYTSVFELLDIDTTAVPTIKGKKLSVSRVVMEVESSRGGWVGPVNELGNAGVMYEIKPRSDADGYGSIALKTFKQEVLIEPSWSAGGSIRVEQRSPLPFAVLSIIPSVDVGG